MIMTPNFCSRAGGRGAAWSEATARAARAALGCVQVDQAKRTKELEKENQRLRRAVSDLTLDNQILKEVAQGKF